jgi:hypothetical protein
MRESAARIQPSQRPGAEALFRIDLRQWPGEIAFVPLVLGMAIARRSFRIRDKKYQLNDALSIHLPIQTVQSGTEPGVLLPGLAVENQFESGVTRD